MTKNKAEFFDFGSCKNPALSDNKTGLLVFRGLFYQFIGHLIVHIRLALQCEAVGMGHLSTRIGPAAHTQESVPSMTNTLVSITAYIIGLLAFYGVLPLRRGSLH